MDIALALKATIAGVALGAIFQKLKLPLPAPPFFAGLMGILGILLGGMLANMIF